MNNSIKTILGIKDPYLKLDEKNFDNPMKINLIKSLSILFKLTPCIAQNVDT